MTAGTVPKSIEWIGGLDGHARLIDQTRLPNELRMIECRDAETMWTAIKRLSVRGAPAIGIAGAFGVVLGVRDFAGDDRDAFLRKITQVCDYFSSARPTGVNLSWALGRIRDAATSLGDADVPTIQRALLTEAQRIRDEDAAMCRAIGVHGEPLIARGCGVLTHCNAGALATSELGTALAPLYLAHQGGRRFHVFASETRPLLQGGRLTAWELQQAGIEVTVLCDSMVAALMQQKAVDLVITGADRIAANGDVANKIGTYGVAVLAKAHNIPFFVAAPSSTFDLSLPDGSGIPIEQRDPDEIRRGFGVLTVPADVPCFSPAFDVTPAELIHTIISDRGLIEPVTTQRIAEVLGAACADT